mmetsp:Transcript_3551/g.4116  ORF Transcript_3551/g.4116 Transcript_3551/m.4116 type:complete len:100 (+) Transcript_3551:72-371(+)
MSPKVHEKSGYLLIIVFIVMMQLSLMPMDQGMRGVCDVERSMVPATRHYNYKDDVMGGSILSINFGSIQDTNGISKYNSAYKDGYFHGKEKFKASDGRS